MKAGTKSVRGTPINNVGPAGSFIGAREGYASVPPQAPKGMSGTVNKQFEGDQKGNMQEGIARGTPAQHELGNPDEASRVRFQGRYGVSPGGGGNDYNNPAANGNGVVFDGMGRGEGYTPPNAATMDSPVAKGAPVFDTHNIRGENIAHLGQGTGASPSQAADDLRKIQGGVMSRDE
jgi:hypothetical protein